MPVAPAPASSKSSWWGKCANAKALNHRWISRDICCLVSSRVFFSVFVSMEFPGSLNRWEVIYNHPICSIYIYTPLIVLANWGALYATYLPPIEGTGRKVHWKTRVGRFGPSIKARRQTWKTKKKDLSTYDLWLCLPRFLRIANKTCLHTFPRFNILLRQHH